MVIDADTADTVHQPAKDVYGTDGWGILPPRPPSAGNGEARRGSGGRDPERYVSTSAMLIPYSSGSSAETIVTA